MKYSITLKFPPTLSTKIGSMQNKHKSTDELDCDTGRVVVSVFKDDHQDGVMSNTHNLNLDIGNQKLEGVLLSKLR